MIKDNQYRHWIETAFRDYGGNPWVFLRELAQNSRDAEARTIRVYTEVDPAGNEIIIFEDDGSGMMFNHARQYLFRLYASSKDNDPNAAGMYGIGFWTVLRYRPHEIIIESRHRRESWGVKLDRDLKAEKTGCHIKQTGTRITLTREGEFKNPETFHHEVKKQLSYYCRYLRRNDRSASSLPVLLNHQPINRPLELSGPLSRRFRRGTVEGVVGLGDRPQVKLYAKGLPAWQGSVLDELSHVGNTNGKNHEIGPGLAPVFLLNGNRLEVNFSRREVMDNRELKRVRQVAEEELSKLVNLYVDSAFPGNRIRWWERFKHFGRRIRQSFWKKLILILVLVIPIEIVLLNSWFRQQKSSGYPDVILRVQDNLYTGATVSESAGTQSIDLSYTPPVYVRFKLFSPEVYDLRFGFIRPRRQDEFPLYYRRSCNTATLTVSLKTNRNGKIFLPQPSGYVIETQSVRLNGNRPLIIMGNGSGEVTVDLPSGGGTIQYRCCPAAGQSGHGETDISRLTFLPTGLDLPPDLDDQLRQSSRLDADRRVQAALDLTHRYISYDTSKATARRYRSTGSQSRWLNQVMQIGRGDCDIFNGFNCILLRRLGIPCRLVVGFIGHGGTIWPIAHAWTEYYHPDLNQWQTVDASIGNSPFNETVPGPLSERQSDTNIPIATRKSEPVFTFAILLMIFCTPLAAFLIFKLLAAKKDPKNPIKPEIKENLARMAIGALLHPDLWGRHSSIWYDSIIPTVRKGNLSLRRAYLLSRAGTLYAGHSKNPLVQRFINSNLPILNLDDPAFARLIRLFPGIIDLDEIRQLRLQPPSTARAQPKDRLLLETNVLLQRAISDPPLLVWAPGLENRERDFLPISLSPLSKHSRRQHRLWRRRIIGINPQSVIIDELNRLFAENPRLARFRLIKIALEILGSPPNEAGRIKEKAGRILFRESQ